MKIVDRQIFLTMPPNTVFSKYKPCSFDDLCIKGDTIRDIDFWYQQISDSIECDNTESFIDVLLKSEETGESIKLDFNCEMRDGLFEKSEKYAVWEKEDIWMLIDRLKECLK